MPSILTPEFVIAEYPFKTYPGGIIALRAIDIMGASRGSLTTEADSRSLCGTVVRETQKVTTNMYSSNVAAFQEAEDSLIIDLSTLPMELDIQYLMLLSYLSEGEWDLTNTYTTWGSTHRGFNYGAATIRWYGDSYHSAENFPSWWTAYVYRQGISYTTVTSPHVMQTWDGTEIVRIRAYSQSGTTIEFLLDQVVLMPYQYGYSNNNWTPYDFTLVGGGTLSGTGENPDGDDGGDSLGKFTIHPYPDYESEDEHWFVDSVGGGDYQRKSSSNASEYFGRIGPDTWLYYYTIYDSTYPDIYAPEAKPALCDCYGLHGTYAIPTNTWADDTFNRVLYDGDIYGADGHFAGSNWGTTPEGFGWEGGSTVGPHLNLNGVISGRALWVDGDKAWMHIAREFQNDGGSLTCTLGPDFYSQMHKARISTADNIKISGQFSVHYTWVAGNDPYLFVYVGTGDNYMTYINSPYIAFNCWTRTWEAHTHATGGPGEGFAGPFDISSWWTSDEEIGWRIEVERYRVRIRVWDASGEEPETWNVDQYRPLYTGGSPSAIEYPYGNNLGIAYDEWDINGIWLHASVSSVTLLSPGFRVAWDNIKIEHDLGGTPKPSYYEMENPHGTKIGQVEIPETAQHLVYWGRYDWTEWNEIDPGYGDPVLTFSTKAWNPTNAPKLQRAESKWWYFRSVHHKNPINLSRIRFRAYGQGDETLDDNTE